MRERPDSTKLAACPRSATSPKSSSPIAASLSANDRTHRDSARELGVGERAVNNALQRARRKLTGSAISSSVRVSRDAQHTVRT